MFRKMEVHYKHMPEDIGNNMIILPSGHLYHVYTNRGVYITEFFVEIFNEDGDGKVYHIPVYFLLEEDNNISPRDVCNQLRIMMGGMNDVGHVDMQGQILCLVKNELSYVFSTLSSALLNSLLAFKYLLLTMDTWNALNKIPSEFRDALYSYLTERLMCEYEWGNSRLWNMHNLREEAV